MDGKTHANIIKQINAAPKPVDDKHFPVSIVKHAASGSFVIQYWKSEEAEIGRGAFGVAYRGVMQQSDGSKQSVAVKTLSFTVDSKAGTSAEPCEHKEARECFINEMDVFSTLRSLPPCPNVIKSYDCVSKDTQSIFDTHIKYTIVMEYAAKGSLAEYLEQNDLMLNPALYYQVVYGIANGICFLHKYNIAHKDLKTSNIFLSDKLVPKIGDFGFAKKMTANEKEKKSGSWKGTLGYLAPEVLSNGLVTKAADVFAFAMILFEIVSRKEAYHKWEKKHLIKIMLKGGRPIIPGKCPPAMRKLISQCWKQQPEQRPSMENVMKSVEKMGGEKKEIRSSLISSPSIGRRG